MEASATAVIDSIAAEFDVAMGRPERVEAGCAELRAGLARPPSAADLERLRGLLPLLRRRSGAIALPVFDLLEAGAREACDPWPLLEGMLASRDRDLARRALDLTAALAESASLAVNREVALLLASRAEIEGDPLGGPEALDPLERILRRQRIRPAGEEPILALYLEADAPEVRRLAARILDRPGEPVTGALAERFLGVEAHAFLAPYLAYTRATHLDLLHLAPEPGRPPPGLASLRRAEARCGPLLFREAVAEVGWSRVNLGIDAERRIGLSFDGSLPLMVSPEEAGLLRSFGPARRVSDGWLLLAHGGRLSGGRDGRGGEDAVGRFRSYNLAHAEALAIILEVGPLTPEKVRRFLALMDAIVEDFGALFSSWAEECAILPSVYGDLRSRVLAELGDDPAAAQLSAELTRLVQTFEDPRTLGEVRTLHGLKRWLHQRGLRLGFRLVEAARATERTLDLVHASPRRVLRVVRAIRYTDFEPEAERVGDPPRLPHAVAVVADGFGRQILHGQESFPDVRIFCYGNEVHYYLTYGTHPAFLRIDYAPPLRGGMIDLEGYGVSKYELSTHPDATLRVIRRFFQLLDFDVRIENTRIHARYDKERAVDVGDLGEKVEALFRLVPYLMDVDWIVGSLALDDPARGGVAEAWADGFASWGVLPLRELLTEDRRGARDRFGSPLPAGLVPRLRAALTELGVEGLPPGEENGGRGAGQIRLERLLRPLRDALARGELIAAPEGLRLPPADLFRREHEAERFAAMLGSGEEEVRAAARVARLVAPLERFLGFETTGSLNGHEVQRARLALHGGGLFLFVLRGPRGIARLATFSRGPGLGLRRRRATDPWESDASCDALELARVLRRAGYLTPGMEVREEDATEDAARLRERFGRASPRPQPSMLPGERVAAGLKASPGRAVGRVLFGTAGRAPEDFAGAVLVAEALRPEDAAFLYRAAGVLSTGGGILSHAGLLATQFRKPALVVSGRWRKAPGEAATLFYRCLEYREEALQVGGFSVVARRDLRQLEHAMREGDLVVLDADLGVLRVLGQEPETLALDDAFRLHREAGQRLLRASDEMEILVLRGRHLRSRHQIERILGKLGSPVLARHAIRELLLGEVLPEGGGAAGERARLLSLLVGNPRVGGTARDYLLEVAREVAARHEAATARAARRIPTSDSAHEILETRLLALHAGRAAAAAADACGTPLPTGGVPDVDQLARRRLEELRRALALALEGAFGAAGEHPGVRHRARQAERIDRVLGTAPAEPIRALVARISRADEAARVRLGGRRILRSEDGGIELAPLVGWKAANLSEAERLGASGLVPPWFAVTEAAFREVLAVPAGTGNAMLGRSIEELLARPDADLSRKSALIRDLWERATLPEALASAVLEAYHRLGSDPPFVAVRSSTREEDTEAAARAGEFDTFLFIRGDGPLLDHLKRAWSGLWTERALHSRAVLGSAAGAVGGGVVVQRIVESRVSGVLQTVNVGEGEPREMVVNAGLGMGEGVVSGMVAADQIVVAKEGDPERGPLRFRYVTADKRERVVFDRARGLGTVRAECLYHQRLRPALEYVELCELVRVAWRLEAAYGYPLDLEFGIEGGRLWILQVRPVATGLAVLRETVERHPLSRGALVEEAKS